MPRFRQIHDGHCTYLQPAERKYSSRPRRFEGYLRGRHTGGNCPAQLREMERGGIDGISLLPPAEYQRKVFRDFAEMVMPLAPLSRRQRGYEIFAGSSRGMR